jgi:hypothetical protein
MEAEAVAVGRPKAPERPNWLSVPGAARKLGVQRARVNQLVRRGRLKVRWFGNVRYVAQESVERYAEYRAALARLRRREGLTGVT